MSTIAIKINNCSECPKCRKDRTAGAGYALDYICTEANKEIAGYVEYASEIPTDVPEWCPLLINNGTTLESDEEIPGSLLLIFNFETGEDTTRYYDVATIIDVSHGSVYDICADIMDSLSSYLEAVDDEDMSYEDIVEDVLNHSKYEWEFTSGKSIPPVFTYRILYV